jgi:SAM-dependent methyltransferase
MNILVLKKLISRARREGVGSACREFARLFVSEKIFSRIRLRRRQALEEEDGFDRRYGTETASLVRVSELCVAEEAALKAVLYWPSLGRTVESVLKRLTVDHGTFTFVDVGSGKGRVLLMAALLPFRRIIGVEISPKLHEIALRNAAVFQPPERKCARIDLVCCDARSFSFPPGNLALYFFDPFEEDVLRQVLANLQRSLREAPREVWIIYLNARFRNAIAELDGFQLVAQSPRIGPKYATIEYDYCICRRPGGGGQSG